MLKKRITILTVAAAVLAGAVGTALNVKTPVAQAEGCPAVRLVFARGSGGERWNDQNYLTWKEALEKRLKTTELDYEFIDLDYEAIGVGVDNLGVSIRALVGAGDAYEFGASVDSGVTALEKMINHDTCAETKYVLGGYSQGAMVVSKAVHSINAEKIIYAATFGDPKLYMPEGKGWYPDACKGKNLSDYRAYVPDCRTYKGLLGAYEPYEPAGYEGKIGVWCNKHDVFCSPYLNISSHLAYIADELYEDAAKVTFAKIAQAMGIKNTVVTPHDTAIVIDSTMSMERLINQYKDEALRLARETIDGGGRVALYDYRDLIRSYTPVEHCNFETCTLEKIEAALNAITTDPRGNGDDPESLLSAAKYVMNRLTWKYGSTKSLVFLTDAAYLMPDRDGTTLAQVVKLSKQIDPVNIYIVTDSEEAAEKYTELTSETGGMVVKSVAEAPLLTDTILARYDSLPQVEERDTAEVELEKMPALTVTRVALSGTEAVVEYTVSGGSEALVALNDVILGVNSATSLTVTGLDLNIRNVLTLVPLGAELRGEAVSVILNEAGGFGGSDGYEGDDGSSSSDNSDGYDGHDSAAVQAPDAGMIKAPNTGAR